MLEWDGPEVGVVQWNSIWTGKHTFVKTELVLSDPWGSPHPAWTPSPGLGALEAAALWAQGRTVLAAPSDLGTPTVPGHGAALVGAEGQRPSLWNPKPTLGLTNFCRALELLFYWTCLRFWHPEIRSQISLGMCFRFQNWKKKELVCKWNLLGCLCCGRDQSFWFVLGENNFSAFKAVFTLKRHSCFQPALWSCSEVSAPALMLLHNSTLQCRGMELPLWEIVMNVYTVLAELRKRQ